MFLCNVFLQWLFCNVSGFANMHPALSASLQFRLLHTFCIFSYRECVDHILYVSSEEAREVMCREPDAVVSDASLWEVIRPDFR